MKRKKLPHKEVKTHVFSGDKYNILWRRPSKNYEGTVDTGNKRRIYIYPNKDRKEFLDTAIHESLHACYRFLEENTVAQAATDISEFLWNIGFRYQEGE